MRKKEVTLSVTYGKDSVGLHLKRAH